MKRFKITQVLDFGNFELSPKNFLKESSSTDVSSTRQDKFKTQ